LNNEVGRLPLVCWNSVTANKYKQWPKTKPSIYKLKKKYFVINCFVETFSYLPKTKINKECNVEFAFFWIVFERENN